MSEQATIKQIIRGVQYAATSATGYAVINVYNYYGASISAARDSVVSAPTEGEQLCPYRSLYHFRPEDARFFFGREVFISRLVRATDKRNFIAVVGPSGSGKSSVVLAGLAPTLEKQQPGRWKFTHFRPSTDPFYALAMALVVPYQPNLHQEAQSQRAKELSHLLRAGKLPLKYMLAKIGEKYHQQRLLLIADQFEELYTLCPDLVIRQQFLDMLLDGLQTPAIGSEPTFTLVLTMRADFMGEALTHRPLAEALEGADVKLGAMTRDELTRAIEKPAQKVGLTFDEGLVDRIVDDVIGEPGNLPLLQFALTLLWGQHSGNRLTYGAYETIGKVEGALARYADQEYQNLSPAQKGQARRIFIQLVHPGQGTVDTRRLATQQELGAENWALVRELADARLVVTGRDETGKETAEVVHEALIRNWDRLHSWMEEDHTFRIWQERLRTALPQWEASQRDTDTLLRGLPLIEAEHWLAERNRDLNEAERTFIHSSIDHQKRREQQRKLALVGTIAVAILMTFLATFAVTKQREAEQQARLARSRELAAAALNNLDNDPELSILLAMRAVSETHAVGEPATTEAVQVLHRAVQASHIARRLTGHTNWVYDGAFSPDGNYLATAGFDGTAKLWDLASGGVRDVLSGYEYEQVGVTGVAFSSDGALLAIADGSGNVHLRSIMAEGQVLGSFVLHDAWIFDLAFSPDGRWLATASEDETAKLLDLATGQISLLFPHDSSVCGLAFSPDGAVLATVDISGTARVWDIASGDLLQSLTHSEEQEVCGVAFNPQDGTMLATGGQDRLVKIWEINTVQPLSVLIGHSDAVSQVAFSPDGKRIASASFDGTAKVWEVDSGRTLLTLAGHDDRLWGVAFSKDGRHLATFSQDKTIKIWRTDPNHHEDEILRVVFSPDGTQLATAGNDGAASLWDVVSGQRLRHFNNHGEPVRDVAFHPHSERLALASEDGAVRVWDTNTDVLWRQLIVDEGPVLAVAFNPVDGTYLAAAGRGDMTIWNVDTGKRLHTFHQAHEGNIFSIAFHPDGERLATAGEDGFVKLWYLNNTSEPLRTFSHPQRAVYQVTFSTDGRWLATASGDNTAKVWDTETGEELFTISGHTERVLGVAFAPNQPSLFTASSDGSAKMWDLSTASIGQTLDTEQLSLSDHLGPINSLAVSPSGQLLVTAGEDGMLHFHRLRLNDLLAFAQTRVTRPLDPKECQRYLHQPDC